MAEINIEKMAHNVAEKAMQELRDNGVFVSRWIPVKFRELTEEENEQFRDECDKAFDCPLPDDGQEVLVSTKWGVDKDTFCIDGYGMYFENYDADDLLAWMPLPEPYKVGDTDGRNRSCNVLPKGHGRLVDADAILEDPFGNTYKDIDIAETIIEADEEVER